MVRQILWRRAASLQQISYLFRLPVTVFHSFSSLFAPSRFFIMTDVDCPMAKFIIACNVFPLTYFMLSVNASMHFNDNEHDDNNKLLR